MDTILLSGLSPRDTKHTFPQADFLTFSNRGESLRSEITAKCA